MVLVCYNYQTSYFHLLFRLMLYELTKNKTFYELTVECLTHFDTGNGLVITTRKGAQESEGTRTHEFV